MTAADRLYQRPSTSTVEGIEKLITAEGFWVFQLDTAFALQSTLGLSAS